ncbi:hypothetical protein ABI59_20125 [Acidobacteria bacterium Mor1]|nr:hypothetical protein ABI59_20125 [Acidobacteria bacterium Mor1]
MSLRSFFVAGLIALVAGSALAAVPTVMNYQGRLTDNSPQQNPLDTTVSIEFHLYDSAMGSDVLWSETWPSVQVVDGIFSVLLGSNGSPIPPTVFSQENRYLELIINGETLAPRQRLGAVGYAFEAERLALACNEGETLQRIGDEWVCADVNVCPQGSMIGCYTGPTGTVNVGACKAGAAQCLPDGSSYGPCSGDVLPTTEVCFNGIDEDCDGTPDNGCACPDGLTNCGGVCVDTLSDSDNCFSCGNDCDLGTFCQNGTCTTGAIYGGMVSNPADPAQPGPGIPSVWEYGGSIGTSAGDLMCQQIGADHACRHEEVLAAESRGELQQVLQMNGQTFWLNRTVLTAQVGGQDSPPGAGGRCNDWTYTTAHISDGEYSRVENARFEHFFDQDTTFSGNSADGHAGSGPDDGGDCGGPLRAILCCN